jgi:ABC-type nitrate/sulfonate/bicarbonate transport system permease component
MLIAWARSRSGGLPFDPLGIVGVLVFIALWWGLSTFQVVPRLFLPPITEVTDFLIHNFFSSAYLQNYRLGNLGLSGSLLYTIGNVLIALALSCFLGIGLGLTSARVNGVRAVFDPIMLTVGTIPVLVTAPFFLIWFGTERAPQVALLTLYSTTIIYMFAQRAVANLDPIYSAAARTLGAGPLRILTGVYLRGTLPEVFGGIRIALAGAWGLEAMAELLGAPSGVGRVIQAVASATDVPTIVATILALGIVAVAFDAMLASVFGFITRWQVRAARS